MRTGDVAPEAWNTMIYYEQPFAKIYWNEDLECVESEWTGFVFGEAYRQVLDKSLELHREKGAPWNLANMRKASVIADEDTKWLIGEWLPRARALGVRGFAIVPPASVLAQMQMQQLKQRAVRRAPGELGIETQYFADMEEARRWIRAKSSSIDRAHK